MPIANTAVKSFSSDTISADTYGTTIDCLNYSTLRVFWNVTNGSATAAHTLDCTLQTCDTDSSDDNDWVDMTPDTGGAFTQVTGTGGANPWPKAQVRKYTTFHRYVRVFLDVTNGTWTTYVDILGAEIN